MPEKYKIPSDKVLTFVNNQPKCNANDYLNHPLISQDLSNKMTIEHNRLNPGKKDRNRNVNGQLLWGNDGNLAYRLWWE